MYYKSYKLFHMDTYFLIQIANHDFLEEDIKLLDFLVESINLKLRHLESKFSPFLENSLISEFKKSKQYPSDSDFNEIYEYSKQFFIETEGYFNPYFSGYFNPTGLVKGWIIEKLFNQFFLPHINNGRFVSAIINGGGDMIACTNDKIDFSWEVKITHPDDVNKILRTVRLHKGAVATSGFSARGFHIKSKTNTFECAQVSIITDSLTVADAWATAIMSMPIEKVKSVVLNKDFKVLVINMKGEIEIEASSFFS